MRWHKVRNKGYEKMKREELHKLLFETLCIIDDICKKEMSGGFWIPARSLVH